MKSLKIALVHDFLTEWGGAERVLETLSEMFPEAPIYTLLYDKEKMKGKFSGKDIRTSYLQNFPKFLRTRRRWLLPFLPTAPETFDLRDFDLVITSSGAWTKGIVTRLDTIHISYIHSPMRFAWDANEEYLQRKSHCFLTTFFSRMLLSYIRVWDKEASDRPDYLIANSKYTQERIKKYYGRESEVVYPPVALDKSLHQESSSSLSPALSRRERGHKERYFLIVSRLSGYKKNDAAIEAFNKLDLPLVIVGEGVEKKRLKKIAGKNVKILGFQPEEKMARIYSGARAFIFPGVDDFGLAPVEAMAQGVPVIAIRKGGAREIVEENVSGEFFEEATPELITDGVRRFIQNENKYDREIIRQKAERFGKERFKKEIAGYINKCIAQK